MAELLLELFSEEIPARMQLPAAVQLKDKVTAALKEQNLYVQTVKTFVTPRRLTLFADGLSLTQETKTTERKGPKTDAPQQAIDGFLRSTGLTLDKLTIKDVKGSPTYFAIVEERGRPTKEIISEILNDTLSKFNWPKSMRWGSHQERWARPLTNICALFGGEVLSLKFGVLEANNTSFGHRFLSPASFKAEHFVAYKKTLKDQFVIVDHEERRSKIIEQIESLSKEKNLTPIVDETLLDEITGLVEWPTCLMGKIEPQFMHLPEEVLISSIRTHQKYICLRDSGGALAPHFIVVANLPDETGDILAGNERVLRARLSDAAFFWQQDKQTKLGKLVPKLQGVTFHAKLGTIADKATRIEALAQFLAVWVPHAKLEEVERAARLSKADLVTEMVGEFPELQGVMGAYYALEQGEDAAIAAAIREHYAPLGPSDMVPTAPLSIAVSLADKMDTLAGMFTIGEKPTGSKDPFALRRAALGIIRIILENKLTIPLRILIERALKNYPTGIFKQQEPEEGKKIKVKPRDITLELLEFFEDRLVALLKGEGIRHDLIHAVFDGGVEDDIFRAVHRVAALNDFLNSEDGDNLLLAYGRATNMVEQAEKSDNATIPGKPSANHLEEREEKVLFNTLRKIDEPIEDLLKENNFTEAMMQLARLRKPVDAFFENVTVNDENAKLRDNRLKLLAAVRDVMNQIANFSLIVK